MIFLGIDAGASTTKVVLIDEENNIIGYHIEPTKANFRLAYETALKKMMKKIDVNMDDILFSVSTGYGREIIDVQTKISEITAIARGAYYYNSRIRTVIDVGGQDSKAICINEHGQVIDFVMNDKCAAGTGRFLEVMANIIGVSIDELGELHLKAEKPISISSTCTVFAESEVISYISKGEKIENIVAGIHKAIAERIYNMAYKVGFKPEILITGGVAKNKGFVYELSKRVGYKLNIPVEPQIIGAFGAAIIAKSYYLRK